MRTIFLLVTITIIISCRDQKTIMRNRQLRIKEEKIEITNQLKQLSTDFDNLDSTKQNAEQYLFGSKANSLNLKLGQLEREYDSLENEFKKY